MPEDYTELFGPKPSVNIPMVKVVNEADKEILRGYYFRWVCRQPCALNDYIKAEDVKECVIYSDFADWNMPRKIKYMIVEPPNQMEILNIEEYRQ